MEKKFFYLKKNFYPKKLNFLVENLKFKDKSCRFTPQALLSLQEASEPFLINMFDQCNHIEIHGKRTTVMIKDIQLWSRLHDY